MCAPRSVSRVGFAALFFCGRAFYVFSSGALRCVVKKTPPPPNRQSSIVSIVSIVNANHHHSQRQPTACVRRSAPAPAFVARWASSPSGPNIKHRPTDRPVGTPVRRPSSSTELVCEESACVYVC